MRIDYKTLRRVLVVATLAGHPMCFAARTPHQPKIVAKNTPTIEVDGYTFKDLNKNGVLDPYEDWRLPTEDRVADLISQMTLEEKAGMMMHATLSIGDNGEVVEKASVMGPGTTEAIINRNIRHFITRANLAPQVMAKWSNDVQAIAEGSRLGIPLNISSDPRHHLKPREEVYTVAVGEHLSRWPEPIGLTATRDFELVKRFGQIAAQEYRAVGIHTALHPQADLATEPRWARINGTFGEDAGLAAEMTKAYVEGFQGKSLSSTSVACITKHWPGGGPQEDGYDPHNAYGKMQVYPGGNFDYHLIPFVQGAFEAGTAGIMPYYGIPDGYDTVGMGFSKYIINNLLRQKYGYDGVVVTDWLITSLMVWGAEDLSEKERHRLVIEAGCDQFGGNSDPKPVTELVNEGAITEDRLDESMRRLLKNMFLLGLFENPSLDPTASKAIVGCKEFRQAAMLAQHKSIVLLKNENDLLPLSENTKIYIPEVTVGETLLVDKTVASQYGNIVDDPADADVAIIKVTAPYKINPEATFFKLHEGTLAYDGADNADQLTVIKDTITAMSGKPVIVAMYLDRPAILSEFIDKVDGMLATFGVSDEALFDVIFGKFNPSGKLPFNLPMDMASVEAQNEDKAHDLMNPLYEFGLGLSYE
jgi:beta-glucosidase